ncbi:hypothetical protein CHX27_09020 [Flavobacterium aurantiibacter]|uniref:Uncharacterized protein n=1 Tax=Flavobacterium aurantiibacter TaxID=2023067 RepID=A0A255ZQL6_9FLAO|nr:hypothetical protein CHX27_09020 [Flavobacterium aurantiibacter]
MQNKYLQKLCRLSATRTAGAIHHFNKYPLKRIAFGSTFLYLQQIFGLKLRKDQIKNQKDSPKAALEMVFF